MNDILEMFKLKIKKDSYRLILTIVFLVLQFLIIGVVFSFPFIKFNGKIRVAMLVVWFVNLILFWMICIYIDIYKLKKDHKKLQAYLKDKFVYIWSCATSIITLSSIGFFLFLNNSFEKHFNIFTLPIAICIVMLVLFCIIVEFSNDKKQFLIAFSKGFLYTFCLLLVATGVFIRNYPDITETQKIASVVAIALGGIPLLVMIIMWISKSLQGNNGTIIKNLKNSWLIFIITILLITIPILLVKLPIDEAIIDALITTFASVAGGSLTLIGVIWTIRSDRESLKQEEYLKYKPWFTGYTDENFDILDDIEDNIRFYGFYNYEDKGIYQGKSFKNNLNENMVVYRLPYIIFSNTDQSNFIIEKITLNGVDAYQKNVIITKCNHFYLNNLYVLKQKECVPEILIYTTNVLKERNVFRLVFEEKDHKVKYNNKDKQEIEIKQIKLRLINIEEVKM